MECPLVGLRGGWGPRGWTYSIYMDTSPFPPPSSTRKRCAERTIDLNSFFSREEDRPKMPRFLLMSCAEEGKTFKTVSAVRLARAIDEAYGKLQAVVRQRNGTILFEARTDEQIGKIKNTTQIAGLQVVVTVHPTLNLWKGVVHHEDFAAETEEDLLNFFKTYGVTELYRIGRKEQGKVILTSTLILTFDRPFLPEMIVTAFYNHRVRQYVPNTLRCFKCQRFGYTQQRCMSVNAVCAKCGSTVHDQQPCDKPPHCVNCEGDHPANDNKCPTFLREREIQKIRVTEKVSFPEAKRRFQIRNPVDLSRSFSSAVKPKSPGVTASCQTHCTPAAVSHFSCQVSPTAFPGDSACIQGGKIIIPTKYKNLCENTTRNRPLRLLLKSILNRHRLPGKIRHPNPVLFLFPRITSDDSPALVDLGHPWPKVGKSPRHRRPYPATVRMTLLLMRNPTRVPLQPFRRWERKKSNQRNNFS